MPHVETVASSAEPGRLGDSRRLSERGAFGERRQRLTIRLELLVGQSADEHRRLGESRVRQQRHAEETPVEKVRRQHRFPQHRERERHSEQPPAGGGKRRLKVERSQRQRDRQRPVGNQVDVIVGKRPVIRDPHGDERRDDGPQCRGAQRARRNQHQCGNGEDRRLDEPRAHRAEKQGDGGEPERRVEMRGTGSGAKPLHDGARNHRLVFVAHDGCYGTWYTNVRSGTSLAARLDGSNRVRHTVSVTVVTGRS